MSKVTIIIPVYNSAEYIGKCIESILNQTYHDYDILIVMMVQKIILNKL